MMKKPATVMIKQLMVCGNGRKDCGETWFIGLLRASIKMKGFNAIF